MRSRPTCRASATPSRARRATWDGHVEALEALRQSPRASERVALVGHDWGGLIGLRWACDHPDAVWAVVATDTGFFSDGRWHGMADALRTPGQGEQLVDSMTLEGFTGMLGSISKGIGPDDAREYFKAFADEPRRRGQLELYRSGDFEKLEPYDGRLAALDVPFLALWGEDDPFAPVAARSASRARCRAPACRSSPAPGTSSTRTRPRRRRGARHLPGRGGAALMHVRDLGEGPPVLLLHPGPGPRRDGLPARRRAARGEPPRAARRPAGQRPLARRRPQRVDAGRLRARRRAARAASSSCATGRCSGTRSAASSRCSTWSTSPTAPRGSSPPAPTRARRRRRARPRTRSRG